MNEPTGGLPRHDADTITPRVLVFAYHDVGYECLSLLMARGVKVVAVITHEDDPREHIWFKSVSTLARQSGVPVYTPGDVNAASWRGPLRTLRPDLIFSFYYRRMIHTEILALAHLGAYNLHGSLLPKYRGRAPINWAVLHGETETGATLHVMEKRADAGDIVDQEPVSIGPSETAQDVFHNVTRAARGVLERQLDNLLAGRAPRTVQDESRASTFGHRRPEDGRIDWYQGARAIYNLIRAVTHPYPGAFTEFGGERFLVWWAEPIAHVRGRAGEVVNADPLQIATGDGCLEVTQWQWQGSASSRGGGHGLCAGTVLGLSQEDAIDVA
ncbi:MAG TPA: formyltransferase [Burkholderiales bacterium]|nr:formyltransferase [Burkholderiales bacterium]